MIRPAGPADLAAIRSILDAPDNLDKLAGYGDAALLAAMVAPDDRVLVLEEGGRMVAFVWVTMTASEDGPKIEEFGAVEPGRGHGARLLADLLDRLRHEGRRRIRLAVAGDNVGAIAFYRRFGFVEGETRPSAWHRRRGPVADAVTMTRPL